MIHSATATADELWLMIRREAESAKVQLELKPCQNLVDYQLPFKNSPLKN